MSMAAALSMAACSSPAEPQSQSSETSSASTEATSGSSSESSTYVSGEWTVNTEFAPVLPSEAELAFAAAYEDYEGALIDPAAYLGSQVVSGTNYAYLCTVTEGDETELAAVTVYEDLEGTSTITSVTPFNLSDYVGKDSKAELAGQQLAGGWAVAADQAAASLPEKVATAFSEATAGAEAAYKPLAYLGNKGESDYAVLCVETSGEVSSLAVLTISDGALANTAGFDIADIIAS